MRLAEACEAAGHTVTFLTLHYHRALMKKMKETMGLKAEIVFADKEGEYTFSDLMTGQKLTGKHVLFGGMRKLVPEIKAALEPLNADVIVSDMLSYAFTEAADALAIPTIIYFPYTITSFIKVTSYMIPTKDTLCGCCGVVCVCPTMMACLFDTIVPWSGLVDPGFLDKYKTFRHRLVMSTTYFGFDRPVHVPPNLVCTGPVYDRDLTVLQDRLGNIDPQLNMWLTQAIAADEPVVYISLGSQVVWQQWYLDTFYEALNTLSEQKGLRVVISLPSKTVMMPEGYDKQMYWVDDWMP